MTTRTYAIKVELSPTREQRRGLACRVGMARFIWNNALARRKAQYEIAAALGEKMKAETVDAAFRATSPTWATELPTAIVRPIHESYRAAWTRFFKRQGGRPKLKNRHTSRQSFSYQIQGSIERPLGGVTSRDIAVPKMGRVRFVEDPLRRFVGGRIVSATISRDVDRWYASLCVMDAPAIDPTDATVSVGVDLNVHAVVVSDGRFFYIPPSLADVDEQIKRAHRVMSRRKKGSARRGVAKIRLGKLYRRARRIRVDWMHKVTSEIVTTCASIAIEDLRVCNMTRSAKGTEDAPGTNVRAKSGLNRAMLNAAFSEFRRQITYKGEWHGRRVVAVDPAYTSKTCSSCGCVNKGKLANYRVFVCEACGFTLDRDVNAAINIELRGREIPQVPGGTGELTDVDRNEGEGREPGAATGMKRQRRQIQNVARSTEWKRKRKNARKTGDSPRQTDRASVDGCNASETTLETEV